RAGRRLRTVEPAALVVIGQRRVVIRVLRADVKSGRIGHAAEVEIGVRAHRLAGRVRVTPGQGLQAADRFRAVGDAARDVRRGRHGQRLHVTAGPVFALDDGRAGRRVAAGLPAGINADFIVRVFVDGVS